MGGPRVGKALAVAAGVAVPRAGIVVELASRTAASGLPMDLLEWCPLPLSVIPGRHPRNGEGALHCDAMCHSPCGLWRRYPPIWLRCTR